MKRLQIVISKLIDKNRKELKEKIQQMSDLKLENEQLKLLSSKESRLFKYFLEMNCVNYQKKTFNNKIQ